MTKKIFHLFKKYIFISLSISGLLLSCAHQTSKETPPKPPLTFIFDFDCTMYNSNPENTSKERGYLHILYESMSKDYPTSREFAREVAKEITSVHNSTSILAFMQTLYQKFPVYPQAKDLDYLLAELHKNQTPGLGEVIKNLKKEHHQVLVIGGGPFSCALIPPFMAQFAVPPTDIYSGYFKDFSREEMHRAIHEPFKYFNCGALSENTPNSEKKSELISYLKHLGKIPGQVIHIGDGENDLEVWQARQADIFIGFGVNKISTRVQENAPIFVKNMQEFQYEITKIKELSQS